MRVWVMVTMVVVLVVAAPSSVSAQKLGSSAAPTAALLWHGASSGLIGVLVTNSPYGSPSGVVSRPIAPPAMRQADSLASRETHVEAGAIIGGLAGAVAGGLAFAHWTHRAGAINTGTGTLGGAVVGAGLIGGLGALAGLLIGSAIHD